MGFAAHSVLLALLQEDILGFFLQKEGLQELPCQRKRSHSKVVRFSLKPQVSLVQNTVVLPGIPKTTHITVLWPHGISASLHLYLVHLGMYSALYTVHSCVMNSEDT